MASLDYAQGVLSDKGKGVYDKLFSVVEDLKKHSRIKVEETHDFTRICLVSQDGDALCEELKKRGIECEFSFGKRCVLIASPFDIRSVKKLTRILKKIDLPEGEYEVVDECCHNAVVGYNDAFNGEGEYVDLHEAVGRVSAGLIGLYPPAIPLCVYGEKITEEAVALVDKFPSSVYGLANGKAFVLK